MAMSRHESAPTTASPAARPPLRPIDEFEKLQREYKYWERDGTPTGAEKRNAIKQRMDRFAHEELHPEHEILEIDMPLSAQGSPFSINDETYGPGLVRVCQCVGSQLLYLIEANRKVEQDRMREGGRTVFMGNIMDRVRRIPQEESA